MSMPKLPEPNPDLTQEQALTMILSSIALEEVALSHIMNAEGEKIQHILNQTGCGDYAANLNNVLAVNKSVTNLLEVVLQNQMILKNKMERVLEYLPEPPCPPDRPCPPMPDCATFECCSVKMPVCFCVVPKVYRCNEPLLWSRENICRDAITDPCGCPEIQLPAAGSFLVSFYAEFEGAACCCNEAELLIFCEGTDPTRIKIAPNRCPCRPGLFEQTVIQTPCAHTPCRASVFVRAPQGMRIKQGHLILTKL